MSPSTEPRDANQCLVQQSVRAERVKRSVKFDQTVEFSDKGVGKLAENEEHEDTKAARLRAKELRHRLRREWSNSDIKVPDAPADASPAHPVRKRSVGHETIVKDTTAPMCPQRKRSIGLTKDQLPLPHRTS